MKKKLSWILVFMLIVSLILAGCSGSDPAKSTDSGSDVNATDGDTAWQPTRHITGIAWASAGGGSDRFVRGTQRAADLNKIFPQTIAPVAKPGGGGAEGMRYLLSQPADGHTFLAVTPSLTYTTLSHDLGWDFSAFKPIVQVAVEPIHLSIRSNDDRFSNIEEFVEYARANPGKLSVGTFGAGTQMDVALLLFAEGLDIQVNAIPFEGTGPRISALLGGHIDASINNVGDDSEQLRTGVTTSLVHFSSGPRTSLPGVPTVDEAFGFPVIVEQWRGFVVHGDTPDNIVEYLEEKFTKIFDTPQFKEYLESEGLEEDFKTSKEFYEFLAEEHETIKKVFQENKLGI